jgi:hypothetical protein
MEWERERGRRAKDVSFIILLWHDRDDDECFWRVRRNERADLHEKSARCPILQILVFITHKTPSAFSIAAHISRCLKGSERWRAREWSFWTRLDLSIDFCKLFSNSCTNFVSQRNSLILNFSLLNQNFKDFVQIAFKSLKKIGFQECLFQPT